MLLLGRYENVKLSSSFQVCCGGDWTLVSHVNS